MGMPQDEVIHTIKAASESITAPITTDAATEEKTPVVAPVVGVESTTTNTEGKAV